jgi:hypothetical protein
VGQEPVCHLAGFGRITDVVATAEQDRAVEQSGGRRTGQQGADQHATGRLPDHSHVGEIPAESGDVLADPAQRGDEVG